MNMTDLWFGSDKLSVVFADVGVSCVELNHISLLKVFWSESLNHLVGLSVGGRVFAGWNPELGWVGWLFHLWIHASSISLLWRAGGLCLVHI